MGDNDKGTFYNMNDDYIEEKYVRAEEERQRKEAADRQRREVEEAQALVEAEKQRKNAEAERLRRKEEADRITKLENARKMREEEDRKRKEKEAEYQDRLDRVEEELKEIERTKADFITEKLNLQREQNTDEQALKADLDKVLLEKREILEREQEMRGKLDDFGHKARRERVALEQKEADAHNRLRELTQERRAIQTEMLAFLQQPSHIDAPAPSAYTPPSHSAPASIPAPAPAPMYQPGYAPPTYTAPPPANYGPSAPSYGGYPGSASAPPSNVKLDVPSYPSYTPAPSSGPRPGVTIESNHPKEDALTEQLNMLDELLNTGVMSQEEYEANKKEALAAAGITDDGPSTSSSPAPRVNQKEEEVRKQIAQLDDYLRQGILGQSDYEDAKKRVLADAGLTSAPAPSSSSGGYSGRNTGSVPYAQVASGTTLVSVTVPPGKRSGENLMISYNGKNYNVVIPAGVSAGQTFNASINA